MEMTPSEIWTRVSGRVQKEINNPTVWLAMQATHALAIDGNFFVAALPPDIAYMASTLQGSECSLAIEDALRAETGRILAFRLIKGQTLADWQLEKQAELGPSADSGASSAGRGTPTRPMPTAPAREVSPSWEKLQERLTTNFKSAPLTRYPHGQAQYVLNAVQVISDTMDKLMPSPGQPRDDVQERALAKVIDRLSSVVNLDSIFISLELLRYRQLLGRDIDLPL